MQQALTQGSGVHMQQALTQGSCLHTQQALTCGHALRLFPCSSSQRRLCRASRKAGGSWVSLLCATDSAASWVQAGRFAGRSCRGGVGGSWVSLLCAADSAASRVQAGRFAGRSCRGGVGAEGAWGGRAQGRLSTPRLGRWLLRAQASCG